MTTYTNTYYDPQRQGYDTALFKTLTGTPAVSSNKLRLNAAGILHYADITKGDITFAVNIPVEPTAGDSRQIGLKALNQDVYIYLDITDAVASLTVKSNEGTTSTAFDWDDTNWSATEIEYRIKWEAGRAELWVNGNKMVTIANANVPSTPMSLYVNNGNSDNMDIGYINAMSVQYYI